MKTNHLGFNEMNRITEYRGHEILAKIIFGTKAERHMGGKIWNTIKLDTQTSKNQFSIMEEVQDDLTIISLDSYMKIMHNWINAQLDGPSPIINELTNLGFK